MATYDTGDQVRVTATFTSSGTGESPSTFIVTHRKPDGSDTTVTTSTVDDNAGVLYNDVVLDQVGIHTVKFAGTDGVIATEVVELEVAKNVFDHS
jgi:hypothetical protein